MKVCKKKVHKMLVNIRNYFSKLNFYFVVHYEDERNLVIDDYLGWILNRAASNSKKKNIQISTSNSSGAISSSPLALASA